MSPFYVDKAKVGCSKECSPLLSISDWVDPGMRTRLFTVAILLPSDIWPGNVFVRVLENGNTLIMVVIWPCSSVDLEKLYRKWLHSEGSDRLENYHPKLLGFKHFLKSCRSSNTDSLVSTVEIRLPFQAQTHIAEKYNLRWAYSNARVVYIELRGHDEPYSASAVQDDISF